MSGSQAVEQLLAAVAREEVVAADLVARALGQSKRKLLRDWRGRRVNGRRFPETHVGREILLASQLVLETYFPHRISGHS